MAGYLHVFSVNTKTEPYMDLIRHLPDPHLTYVYTEVRTRRKLDMTGKNRKLGKWEEAIGQTKKENERKETETK
jgi:hypothetical protein